MSVADLPTSKFFAVFCTFFKGKYGSTFFSCKNTFFKISIFEMINIEAVEFNECLQTCQLVRFCRILYVFLKGNTAVRFFFFFFFFFHSPLESESSTLHTLFMKTWSEFFE